MGRDRVACWKCRGVGSQYESQRVTCSGCAGRGSGYAEGHFTCHVCYGSGSVTRQVNVTCSACGGSGSQRGAPSIGSGSARIRRAGHAGNALTARAVIHGLLVIGVIAASGALFLSAAPDLTDPNLAPEWRNATLLLGGASLIAVFVFRRQIAQALCFAFIAALVLGVLAAIVIAFVSTPT